MKAESVISFPYKGLGDKNIKVLPGVMKAADSTEIFLELIDDLINHPAGNQLKGKEVLQTGANQGAIAIKLLRAGAKLTVLDIDPQSIRNLKHNLKDEDESVKKNLKFAIISDLDSNHDKVKELKDKKYDFFFFNNPIIKMTGDTNNSAGGNFELVKKTITEVLPRRLKPGAKAFMLSAEFTPGDLYSLPLIKGTNKVNSKYATQKQKKLWDTSKVKELISEEQKKGNLLGWTADWTDYRSEAGPVMKPNRDYSILEITVPKSKSTSIESNATNADKPSVQKNKIVATYGNLKKRNYKLESLHEKVKY